MNGVSVSLSATPICNNTEVRAGFRAARGICRRHCRNVFLASVFLPKRKRDAIYAVYAFCRMIEDALALPGDVDSNHSSTQTASESSCGCGSDSMSARLEMFRD